MREDLTHKFEELRRSRFRVSQRSTKLREIHLRKEIISTALSAVPSCSSAADCLRELYVKTTEEDIKLCPWKGKRFHRLSAANKDDSKLSAARTQTSVTAMNCEPEEVHTNSLRRGTARWQMEKALDTGNPDLAEKLSDLVHELESTRREKTTTDVVANTSETPKRPHWTFEAKQRWEFKSNM
ncbi:hypothetical protein EG68_06084 [Paragonimus skrjabini miyazakii]|uniref:Uncharacterized protein n=1 Tax=Paragonimus skrjabini miyazakii TaxID=59628 RepID=A0A8S9YY07_9TREM|nr:hypothetical protein EG68_06084 [Paragonimus skrjabini miyazakii]